MTFQLYSEALDYLYGFVNWEVRRDVRYSPEAMTLARPRAVLEAVGNPQNSYPIIHITGTKGKGSVGAMCAAAAQAAGLHTGLYSSPHLQDFRERFRIDNQLISPEEFTTLVNTLQPALDSVPDLTFFEAITALGFLYFAQNQVDLAVIEVGLGGRLDATNVVTPLVSVITSLSYDHMHLLGNSLASIAREKGGIIKPGVPLVSAPQPPEALEVLVEIAAERGAPLTLVGRDWLYTPGSASWSGQPFSAGRAGEVPEFFCTALPGEHQALNATVALSALDHVRRAGLPIDREAVRRGFRQVDWPGRLEVVEGTPPIVLDAAHNGSSAYHLCDALTELFPRRPLALIFGVSADKDIRGIFDALLPITDVLIAAQANHPRALSPDLIEETARQMGFAGPVEQIPAAAEALARATELIGPQGVICTTGSLFIVGDMRTVLGLPPGHVDRSALRHRMICSS